MAGTGVPEGGPAGAGRIQKGQPKIMRRLLGLLALLAALGALVVVVSASAAAEAGEEVTPTPPASEEEAPANEPASPVEGEESNDQETPSVLLDASCNNGHVCVWNWFGFQGAKGESLCTGGPHYLVGTKYSAKNRCANKASWLRLYATATMGCLNPGGQTEGTEFKELWIGKEGSHC